MTLLREVTVGGATIGWSPGSRAGLLVESLFYDKHSVVCGTPAGDFDEQWAGELLQMATQASERHGVAIAVDVIAASAEAIARFLPFIVGGRVWGAVVVAASSGHPPLPPDTVDRLAAFTELMATAIANSVRAEIERLAQEQTALRRVAPLVARGADTSGVFAAVAREVAEVMDLPVPAIQRYDDETMTMLASWSDRPHPFHTGTRWPLHQSGLAAHVRQTGRAGVAGEYATGGAPLRDALSRHHPIKEHP